jgi:hypothetical protein
MRVYWYTWLYVGYIDQNMELVNESYISKQKQTEELVIKSCYDFATT